MGKRTEAFRCPSLVSFNGLASYQARANWDRIFPVIADAVEGIGETSKSILALVESKAAQVWTAEQDDEILSVFLTQVTDHPKRKVCSIIICTGHDFQQWVQFTKTIEEWAKSNGCTHMKHDARKGWERILKPYGYQSTHVVLEKAL